MVHAEARLGSGDVAAAHAAHADARRAIRAPAARLGERARARFLEAVPDNARCLALAAAWGAP